jgi:hypothetical protein
MHNKADSITNITRGFGSNERHICLVRRGSWFQISVRIASFHTAIYSFPQFLLANGGIVLQIMPRLSPSTSFQIHYSLIILLPDDIQGAAKLPLDVLTTERRYIR